MQIKIGWNRWNDSHWGYNYNENYDYHHEFCFYKFYICWK